MWLGKNVGCRAWNVRKGAWGTRAGEQQRVVPRSSQNQTRESVRERVALLSKMPSMATTQFKGFRAHRYKVSTRS